MAQFALRAQQPGCSWQLSFGDEDKGEIAPAKPKPEMAQRACQRPRGA